MDEQSYKKLISELQAMPVMEGVSMSQVNTSGDLRHLLTWLIRLGSLPG